MYIGIGWRVKGNKEAAENLANFLINCHINNITPIEPIELDDSIRLYYRETHFPFKNSGYWESVETSGYWASGDNLYRRLLTESEIRKARTKEKALVVSLLKGLDKEGIVLPFFYRMKVIPNIISNRVSYINNNKEHENFKLSEVLKRDNPASGELFSGNFTQFDILDYTVKAVSLKKQFMQQGPETTYRGDYFLKRGSVSLQDIIIKIEKEIRLKKEAIEKCPLKVSYLETDIENDIIKPRKVELIDKAGDKFTAKKTEQPESGGLSKTLLINKNCTDECRSGAFYNPKHTEDLITLETLAYWFLENNVLKEDATKEVKKKL